MTISSTKPGQPATPTAKPWRAPVAARVASLVPFAIAAYVKLAAPILTTPMFEPQIAGLPLDTIVGGLILAWAGFGALIVWTTGSRIASTLALAFLTVPSLLALLFAPAVILIVQTFGNLP